jgi:hypothetical protein
VRGTPPLPPKRTLPHRRAVEERRGIGEAGGGQQHVRAREEEGGSVRVRDRLAESFDSTSTRRPEPTKSRVASCTPAVAWRCAFVTEGAARASSPRPSCCVRPAKLVRVRRLSVVARVVEATEPGEVGAADRRARGTERQGAAPAELHELAHRLGRDARAAERARIGGEQRDLVVGRAAPRRAPRCR